MGKIFESIRNITKPQNASKVSQNEKNITLPEREEETSPNTIPPKKSVNRTRNKTMNLRFSPEELEEMNEIIAKSGMNKTDFILECIRDHDVFVVEDLSEAMTEFRKQGININQIAKAMNEYAAGLKKLGLRIYNENATWRELTKELSDLKKENYKTQNLLESIFEEINSKRKKGK